eukprot:scaffold43174_cov24-Prasinocladus_malaysianus.AAC.1
MSHVTTRTTTWHDDSGYAAHPTARELNSSPKHAQSFTGISRDIGHNLRIIECIDFLLILANPKQYAGSLLTRAETSRYIA